MSAGRQCCSSTDPGLTRPLLFTHSSTQAGANCGMAGTCDSSMAQFGTVE
jgi:hypothetical protein